MATMNLDMPLDEIIKKNKQNTGRGGGPSRGGGGGRGRGRRRGRGGSGRGGSFLNSNNSRSNNSNNGNLNSNNSNNKTSSFLRPRRPSAFQVAKSFVSRRPAAAGGWGRGLLQDALGDALGIVASAKLFISNLDYGVSNEDIKELFSEIGELKHFGIHYDRSGRSIGTADVVFKRRPDAIAALKRYNGVQLDGKPMKIELISTNFLPPVRGVYGGSSLSRGRASAAPRGGNARGRGSGFARFRGRGRGRGRRSATGDKKEPTIEDLDADLEKYHKDAMQTE